VKDVCHAHGITDSTFYRWRRRYGGALVGETRRMSAERRLHNVEAENRRLKRRLAALDRAPASDSSGR
jgi:putative transposase